jgi:hypothetical protein
LYNSPHKVLTAMQSLVWWNLRTNAIEGEPLHTYVMAADDLDP